MAAKSCSAHGFDGHRKKKARLAAAEIRVQSLLQAVLGAHEGDKLLTNHGCRRSSSGGALEVNGSSRLEEARVLVVDCFERKVPPKKRKASRSREKRKFKR